MRQGNQGRNNLELELTNMKRNPYLVDYTLYKQERARGASRRVAEAAARTASGTGEGRRSRVSTRSSTRAGRRRQRIYRRLVLSAMGIFAVAAVIGFVLWELEKTKISAEAGTNRDSFIAEGNGRFWEDLSGEKIQGLSAADFGRHPAWTEDFLTPNEYSRPGDPLEEVTSIFVHYTANRGTSAAQNRSYFEQLKDTQDTSASAHFIIGYDGEIIQCIPLDEIAYAVKTRNYDSISIECCYLEKDGSFTKETYDALLELLRWLMEAYDLDEEDILRHYDCGGKKCPLYYTENPGEWEKLKEDL